MMERIAHVRIEKLPEGLYMAIWQSRTRCRDWWRREIARDVARRLLAAQAERDTAASPPLAADAFVDPPVISGGWGVVSDCHASCAAATRS